LLTLLPADGKAGKAFSDKNALTDQYLEQREPSQAEVGTVLAIAADWHFATLETTLKQKTTGNNKYDLLSVAAACKQAGGFGRILGQEKFQLEVIHGNRKVVEF
jgi:hypothetical protein